MVDELVTALRGNDLRLLLRLSAALMQLTKGDRQGDFEYCIPEHYLCWWLRQEYMGRLSRDDLPDLLQVRSVAVGWNAISAEILAELCAMWGWVAISRETLEMIRQALERPDLLETHRRVGRGFLRTLRQSNSR